MRDVINYYYNLNPDKVIKLFDYYYFYFNSELYYFVIYDRKLVDINSICNLNMEMLNKDILVNEFIYNRDNNVITYVNDIPYILMKVFVNINKSINLAEISYLSGVIVNYSNNLMRSNWASLWSNKIDYLEYFHEQNYQKFTLLSESFDYFIGMAENAISYIDYVLDNFKPDWSDIGVISHDVLRDGDSVYALYNPLNIIIDHKARDLAEYIKLSFFVDNYNIFLELDDYFRHNYYSLYGIGLVMARLLYPSFYFDMYDYIANGKINEYEILKITSRASDYEMYLCDVFCYFKQRYDIKEIEWLKK